MMGMLARMYEHYKKNIFLFFVMHPSFYLSILLMLVSNYNMYTVMLFVFKSADIIMKIMLIKQVFIQKDISSELTSALLAPVNKFLPYAGVIVYPPMIYLAFS